MSATPDLRDPELVLSGTAMPSQSPSLTQVPARLDCGVVGGRWVLRDTSGMNSMTDNLPDSRNSADFVQVIVGKDVQGYEWARFTRLDNFSDAVPGFRSEHVGDYLKVHQHGSAPSFGRCTEMRIFNGKGASVAHEYDLWIESDTDREDNGSRIGLDMMLAGSNSVTDQPRAAGATTPFRSSVPDNNPHAYWSFGAMLRGIKEAGVQVTSWLRGGTRAFEVLGKWSVGIDFSQAQMPEAIRLAAGQAISFEPTGQRHLKYKKWSADGKGDRWQFMAGQVPVIEIDSDGNVYKKGVRVL